MTMQLGTAERDRQMAHVGSKYAVLAVEVMMI